MSRRKALKYFLAGATTLVAAQRGFISMANGKSYTIADKSYQSNLGIQLYSVRKQLLEDAGNAFETLAQIGFQHVEWFDVTTLETQAPIAKSNGLPISSAHVLSPYITGEPLTHAVLPSDLNSPEKLIEKLNRFEIKHLVLSYLFDDERQHIDQYKYLSEQLNRVGELCQPAGIQLCYHNHDFEFQKLNGQRPFDLLLNELDHQNVKFELDVFWAEFAGLDPGKLINQLANRCALLHLKDLKQTKTAPLLTHSSADEELFKPVGSGVIDFAKVLASAKNAGVTNVYVEQDHTTGHIFDDLQSSFHYLQKLDVK
jgi:sugar phosphate isomerase/epimerase